MQGVRRSVNRAAALCLALVASDVRTAMAEPCARAQLSGDASAVASVTAALEQLGLSTGGPAPGCPGIEAVVEVDRDGGIAVAIRSAGRSEGRTVSDPAMAAAWIESWVRDDVDGGWFAPPALTPVATPPAPAPRAAVAMRETSAPEATSSIFARVAIGAAYESTWSDDGSGWTGASVSACTIVGPLCIGGRLRASLQSSITRNMATASRRDAAMLATAAYPLTVGRMTIAPELGAGLGRVDTSRIDGCMVNTPPCDPTTDPNCMPMDPMCTDPATGGKIYVGDHLHAVSYTPRLAAALRIAVPLFEHVWLEGLASATLAPFGHTAPYLPGSSAAMLPGPPEDFALPGEPSGGLQLGIGLRVGGP